MNSENDAVTCEERLADRKSFEKRRDRFLLLKCRVINRKSFFLIDDPGTEKITLFGIARATHSVFSFFFLPPELSRSIAVPPRFEDGQVSCRTIFPAAKRENRFAFSVRISPANNSPDVNSISHSGHSRPRPCVPYFRDKNVGQRARIPFD